MITQNSFEVNIEQFHLFLNEILPKHNVSSLIIDELSYRKFHMLSSFKKDFINEILKNYYGMYFSGCVDNIPITKLPDLKSYKLKVTDKKLCTFFILKYAS